MKRRRSKVERRTAYVDGVNEMGRTGGEGMEVRSVSARDRSLCSIDRRIVEERKLLLVMKMIPACSVRSSFGCIDSMETVVHMRAREVS